MRFVGVSFDVNAFFLFCPFSCPPFHSFFCNLGVEQSRQRVMVVVAALAELGSLTEARQPCKKPRYCCWIRAAGDHQAIDSSQCHELSFMACHFLVTHLFVSPELRPRHWTPAKLADTRWDCRRTVAIAVAVAAGRAP